MKKKVFISGGITGIENCNRSAFYKAEEYLKSLNYRVYNPQCLGFKYGIHRKPEFYMRKCLKRVMKSDMIYMLNNWEKSTGSSQEHCVSKAINIEIVYED